MQAATTKGKKVLALLALLLALMGLGASAAAPLPDASRESLVRSGAAQSNEFTAESIPGWREALPGPTGAYGPAGLLVDAARNTFETVKNENPQNNNQTWAELARHNEAGVETGRWYVNPKTLPPGSCAPGVPACGWKIDAVANYYTGTGVYVAMTVHTYGTTVRERDVQGRVIPNIFTYDPAELQRTGAEGAYDPIAAQQECEPVDYALIRQIVREEAANAATLVINNMISKSRAALQQEGVLTLANVHDSYGLYLRFVESTYEQAGKVLDERGIFRLTPTPTPAP